MASQHDFPPLKNDLILRAAKKQPVERVPVWVMRQAGRYLPEFLEVRKTADFFTMCRTPELAAKVTLQPIARFDLDAAIIFSDILVVPQALGMEVLMKEAKGPVFPSPLLGPEDLQRLKADVDVNVELKYVFDAITLTRRLLEGKVPLIGFSGAPWTLMAYMIEGEGSKTWHKSKSWLFKHPQSCHQLLSLLTRVIIDYLSGQVKAGAQLIQVFDSWAGELSPSSFKEFALPYLKQIADELKKLHPEVPLIVFPKGANYAIEMLQDSKYDVVGIDWTVEPDQARKLANGKVGLQGNLDPAVLYADKETITREVRTMLEGFGVGKENGLIGNLGHGMNPNHSPEGVEIFVNAIHQISEELIQKNKK